MTADERASHRTSYPRENERRPPPGWDALLLAAVVIGVVLLGIQLWLLTVALDIFLAGERGGLWVIVLCSGLVFIGGLFAVRVVSRRWPAQPPR
jgi:hypothetical protein